MYTPPHLADFVLEQVRFAHSGQAETLLDPACGAGVFLERAVAFLAARPGTKMTSGGLADAVEAGLFGIDIDETACEMTRETVRRAVRDLGRHRVASGFFRDNVKCADFLFDDGVAELGRGNGGFQFVVGNPPYVATTRISPEYKARLRGAYRSASGRLDLYAMFMERSLELLATGGQLALLTPDKFLTSQTARALRALLLQGNAMKSIARFRSHKVFSNAAIVPCVTVIQHGARSGEVSILECAERPDKDGAVAVLDRRSIQQRSLSSGPWHVHGLAHHDLAHRLQGGHPTLAHVTVRVSAGPATGRDGVYVFPRGAHQEIEPALLRPAVRGRDIDAFRIIDPRLDALVPYVFDAHGNASLADLAEFPGALSYLQRYRADLESRHCVRVWGKRWYDLHDQVLFDLARQTKILVPDVANSNRFAVDRGGHLPLHSVYYLLPRSGIDPDYLCAILNSRVAQFLVRLFAPVVKDGFRRYRQQFVASLPIPLATTDQTREIAAAAGSHRESELDALVARLFRMSLGEYQDLDRLEEGEQA